MWSTKIRNIWDALYPVALYVVVSDCVYMLLTLAIGENAISPMALQILTALLSSPSIVCPYFSDRRGQSREMREKRLFRLLLVCAAAVCLSVSLNNLILMTDLKEQSETYQKVNASFFSSTVWVELFGTSVVTPILEEMLYRGIVYNRLKRSGRTGMAIVISGLAFGFIHFNLVQFLYAGLIGIFLAVVYETEGTACAGACACGGKCGSGSAGRNRIFAGIYRRKSIFCSNILVFACNIHYNNSVPHKGQAI